jgi:hypothetical protein
MKVREESLLGKGMASKSLRRFFIVCLLFMTVFAVSNPAFANTVNNPYITGIGNTDTNPESDTPTETPTLIDLPTTTPVEPAATVTGVPSTQNPGFTETPELSNPTLTDTPELPSVTPTITDVVPTSTLTNTTEPPTATTTPTLITSTPTITNTPTGTPDDLNKQGSTQYYLNPTGSDSNSGTSADSPWLTPNHTINCGDTILAASGSYAASNFGSGKWGTVTCAGGNNVAWLICASFDSCKINTNGNDAMRVNASYWGIQGWEATNTSGACFTASPANSSVTIHHIIFANNIANGCKNNGFNSYPYMGASGPSGVDYLAIIGNLIYNSAGGNSECFSGISIYEPRNFDTNPGTHIYIAQNISWSNVDGSSCPGNSDGNGIILDDWNGDQSGFSTPFSGQGVVENNLVMGNGSSGIEPYHNSNSPILIQYNTSYGNYTDPHHTGTYNGEFLLSRSSNVTMEYNIAQSTVATVGQNGYPVYAFYVGLSDSTDKVDYHWIYSKFGNNTGVNSSSGFSFGSHQTLAIDPGFANPSVPGAPSCSGKVNTLDCMRNTLANFVPSTSGISGYGYQPVTSAYASNDYYPAWLCNTTFPSGIISNYCNSGNEKPVPPTATTTNTPAALTATRTNTPVAPTATKTDTPVTPTATRSYTPAAPTATRTNTPVAPTATKTDTVVTPNATATNTPAALTATRTNNPVVPTATKTDTPVMPTATRTYTPAAPTATRTNNPVAPTATKTDTTAAPTATKTDTPAAPTDTQTKTAVPPTATATAASTPLPPPNLLAPSNNGTALTTRPTFEWKAVSGATGYTIQLSTSTAFSSIIATVKVSTSNYTVKSDLARSKTYYWRVMANGNRSSTWSQISSFMSADPPGIPPLASPTNGALLTDYQPRLDWRGVNADKYQVQLAKSSTFSASSLVLDVYVNLDTHLDLSAPLQANSNYYWHIRALYDNGQYSLWSPYLYFKTAMLPPPLLDPINIGSALTTRPIFDWGDVIGATGYTIQISKSPSFRSTIVNKPITNSLYTPTSDLPRKALLYWRVSATGNRPSVWSQVFSFTSADPPPVPVHLNPANNALVTNNPASEVFPASFSSTYNWSAVAGADHYQLQVATNLAFSPASIVNDVTTTNGSYSITIGLVPNTTFFWRVRSFNAAGQYSLWSALHNFRTAMTPPVLASPVNNGQGLTTRPTFDWGDVSGAMGFKLQVSIDASFSSPLLNTSVTTSTYTPPSDLPRSKILYWRVYAKGNNPSAWSTVFTFTSANPPYVPSLLSPPDNSSLANYTPTLDWNDPLNTDIYQVQLASSSSFSDSSIVLDTKTTPSSFTPPSPLPPNRTFFWRVRAYDPAGEYSLWSSVWQFHTRLPAPALFSPDNAGTASTNPTFDWEDVKEANGYVIQVSTSLNYSTYVVNTTVSSSSYSISLSKGKKYYWRVYAKGTYSSKWSEARNFITK